MRGCVCQSSEHSAFSISAFHRVPCFGTQDFSTITGIGVNKAGNGKGASLKRKQEGILQIVSVSTDKSIEKREHWRFEDMGADLGSL